MLGSGRHRGDIHVPALLEPSQPITFGVRLLVDDAQICAGAVHQERSQVAIVLASDLPEPLLAAARVLSRGNPQPGGKARPFLKTCGSPTVAIAQRRTVQLRNLRLHGAVAGTGECPVWLLFARRFEPGHFATAGQFGHLGTRTPGVWAESNTRESIYDALRRRETFATSGTRFKFRFFGCWSFDKTLLKHKDWIATAYAKGVPMGSDLPVKPAGADAPSFAIWAVKDPNSGNLNRAQVIKVWEEGGRQREEVFDVAWAGNRRADPKTGKLPAVGDTVDLKTGKYTNTIGATELKTVWRDPEFNAQRFAAHYLRVLEIPTPRWSTLLAIENGLPLAIGAPATEEQRGWSSPVWYEPPQMRAFVQ